ncbi:unnamed protein product [Strongylus vulgaris]|uniref:Uncharacterized protein n=1 Tax=Strongylus vulgaris TaxID=40348 RepID=A0A3P7JKE4_STRVU|nr:unnamed protein product [Strongylus vulgaris]
MFFETHSCYFEAGIQIPHPMTSKYLPLNCAGVISLAACLLVYRSVDYGSNGDATLQLRKSNDDVRCFATPASTSNVSLSGSVEGPEPLFEPKSREIEEEGVSRGTEVKSEVPDTEVDVSALFGQERSGAMVSSSGIVLSETVMDELLRMVLSRKDTLLNDACDEKLKAKAWREVYEFVRAITKVTPTVDELKEMFRRKQVYINDIVSQHGKADIFSVHGFARYIQSIVNKCLPEEKFSARERELGTYILRKTLSPNECAPPSKKRMRLGELSERTNDAAPCHECSSRITVEVDHFGLLPYTRYHNDKFIGKIGGSSAAIFVCMQ